jgi:hypothetical protein
MRIDVTGHFIFNWQRENIYLYIPRLRLLMPMSSTPSILRTRSNSLSSWTYVQVKSSAYIYGVSGLVRAASREDGSRWWWRVGRMSLMISIIHSGHWCMFILCPYVLCVHACVSITSECLMHVFFFSFILLYLLLIAPRRATHGHLTPSTSIRYLQKTASLSGQTR